MSAQIVNILIAAGAMGAMGLVFGMALSIIGRKFDVPVNPLELAVRELLPGANCGGCGHPGCDGYAAAVAEGREAANLCPVGGDDVAAQIAAAMGVEPQATVKQVAMAMCRGGEGRCHTRFEYAGPMDCKSASLAGQGDKACAYSCLGLGDCVSACQFGAITVENRLARVDPDKCASCGACVAKCPRDILRMFPRDTYVHRTCSAMERGRIVRDSCTAGCLACGKCERSCKFGAITLVNNLPEIDTWKCVGCMRCADECPTGALDSNEAMRRRAVINLSKCDACDECAKVCQFDAVIKNDEGKHAVVAWNCTGCGECVPACAKGCIQLLPGVKFSH